MIEKTPNNIDDVILRQIEQNNPGYTASFGRHGEIVLTPINNGYNDQPRSPETTRQNVALAVGGVATRAAVEQGGNFNNNENSSNSNNSDKKTWGDGKTLMPGFIKI